ncbi:hypothetical protein N9N96_01880 [Candidatus Pelagibacter ubique]|nr:hypothetical protein [Candidatus Pelagibacter ubique]
MKEKLDTQLDNNQITQTRKQRVVIPFRGYDNFCDDYDDGSVEIDLSRTSTGASVINEPRLTSKVAESIWRLKNKK